MTEKELERKLGHRIKQLGGLYYKFVSPGNAGVPDRIVIFPDGRLVFVELKTESGILSAMQTHQIKRLREHGQEVVVLAGWYQIARWLDE